MSEHGRILGIDYGRARCGLALSDPMRILASPYETVRAQKSVEATAEAILKAIEGKNVVKIVVGLPHHMSGEESELSREVKELAEHIKAKCDIPVTAWDERLTSSQATRQLKEHDMSRKKRAKVIDEAAATIILQSYLESL